MPKGTSDAGSATHRTPKLEGRVSAPDSAIRRWDRIALLLHYVINPARRLTTNIRLICVTGRLQKLDVRAVRERLFCDACLVSHGADSRPQQWPGHGKLGRTPASGSPLRLASTSPGRRCG